MILTSGRRGRLLQEKGKTRGRNRDEREARPRDVRELSWLLRGVSEAGKQIRDGGWTGLNARVQSLDVIR